MATRKDTDPKATRGRILREAGGLLRESGGQVEKLSMREVAKRAEVSLGSVQHHFQDKGSLINACIDTAYGQLAHGIPLLLQTMKNVDYAETLERAVRFGWRFSRESNYLIRILESQINQEGGLDAKRHQSTQEPLLRAIAPLVAEKTGLSEVEARLRINEVFVVIGRYAILREDALRDLCGEKFTGNPAEVVENHLVNFTIRVLSA